MYYAIIANNIKSKGLVSKNGIAGFINNTDLDKKLAILPTKDELKVEQERIPKFETFGSSNFRGKSRFEADGAQNYLVFQSMYRYSNYNIGVGSGSYTYF